MTRTLHILLLLLAFVISGTADADAQKKGKEQFVLVIDPGHGGKDPGAIGRKGYKEKTINLNVSKAVGEMINDKYPEVKIIYTRSKDVYIPLMQRANIANRAKADLFISIHTNASKSRQAHGCETFTLGAGSNAEAKAAAKYENEVILQEENFEQVYNGFDPRSSESYIIFELLRSHDMEKSVSCAEHIQKRMVTRSRLTNRGVSSAGFLVLHQTAMPSILVELGFISNPTEEKFLVSNNGQKALAKGIFEGFSSYYEEYKKTKLDNNTGKTAKRATNENVAPKAEKETVIPSPQATVGHDDNSSHNEAPIFKVQILASSAKLKSNDKRLKGVKADYYREGGTYKYTCGASTDYNAIAAKRKELAKKFKEAFVVAFKNGKRIDTNKAIKEFKNNK